MPKTLTACPAQDWAWQEIAHQNLRWDVDSTPTALVLLAFARMADEALDSPNGYDYTTATKAAVFLQMDLAALGQAVNTLVRAGFLVHRDIGYRVPEEAFNR